MILRTRLAWLPVSLLTLALLSVLLFLYVKTQSFGESAYYKNIALLRHLKETDAQWELDVLKSKMGINPHYDALASSQAHLSRLIKKVEADLRSQNHSEAAQLASSGAQLQRVIQEKADLVEQFKSNNSVLRNSLTFLPTAAEDVQPLFGRTGAGKQPAAKRASTTVNKLLLASLLYSQSASDDRGVEIQHELSQLDADLPLLPVDLQERLNIFQAHVQTILREQKHVNNLLASIAAVPTASKIDGISNVLTVENQGAQLERERYRGYLLSFSVVLVALLLYAALHLLRSHRVINRVNRALQSVNENLEQRVQERTHELRETQNELVATARRAGMAEIATNVLHNVGNILNSVNISASLVSTQLRSSKATGLVRAVALMDEHANDLGDFMTRDVKGKLLPTYLRELAQALQGEQVSMVEELDVLSRSVDHIKEVIAAQQSYAGTPRLVEFLSIRELLDHAVRINAGALARHKVTVVSKLAALPALPLDRNRILQILVNLISNAKQAMQDGATLNPCITLGAELIDAHFLRITVADNGEGIASENLTRVFAHGFTTRKEGHGFGLHSCALAAQEMGGSLSVHSEGEGHGTRFTLDIPIDAREGQR